MLSQPGDSAAWEYTIVHTDRLNTPSGPQLAPIWRRKYADGSTDWDQINKLGQEGWEMVSAFPVEAAGTLLYVAFVFKRPRRAADAPPALPAPAESDTELGPGGEPEIGEPETDEPPPTSPL